MKLALLALVALLATGCQSLRQIAADPDAAYVAAATLFAETIEAAADARDAGLLGDNRIRRIDANIQSGNRILGEWRAALDAGDDAEPYRLLLLATIRQINEYLTTKEATNGPGKCDDDPQPDRKGSWRYQENLRASATCQGWREDHGIRYRGSREGRQSRDETLELLT